MKTKKEIEQLAAHYWAKQPYNEDAYVVGYTQCQEDMARKEIQPEDIWNKESQDKIKEHILNHANNQSSEAIIETELAAKKYAEEDMADKKYTEKDIRKVIDETIKACNISQKESYGDLEIDTDKIINSLNKQD